MLALNAHAQQEPASRAPSGPWTQITIEGNRIAGNDVLIHKGAAYVKVSALAEALGASVSSQGEVAVLSIPGASESECNGAPEVRRLSDAYRKAAVRIPDEIERLRVLVDQKDVLMLASRFDAVDHQISEAEFQAKTPADKSVSFALSHASSALAIMYYKLLRGVPPEIARRGQLDSELCTIQSKFALEAGRLSGKESCSIFHSAPAQGTVKRAANN